MRIYPWALCCFFQIGLNLSVGMIRQRNWSKKAGEKEQNSMNENLGCWRIEVWSMKYVGELKYELKYEQKAGEKEKNSINENLGCWRIGQTFVSRQRSKNPAWGEKTTFNYGCTLLEESSSKSFTWSTNFFY